MSDQRLKAIRNRIAELPKGGITYKKISGHSYAYYQWSQDGKQHSRRVKDDELEKLSEGIKERRELEETLKRLQYYEDRLAESGSDSGHLTGAATAGRDFENLAGTAVAASDSKHLAGNAAERFVYEIPERKSLRVADENVHEAAASNGAVLRMGEDLLSFARPAAGWQKRSCYSQLHAYLFGEHTDRIFILYGLRRTGKTTLIRQAILDMDREMLERTAFLQAVPGVKMADLRCQLSWLERQGYRYVFIDEVTQLDDFIEGAAVLPDIFASSGMRIVLSGTDSLGFLFSEDEQLYDRCIMLHTTFIPYREFERVLGICGIDEYIRYGGTMSAGGVHYNRGTFATADSADEYVDLAIARNIQHSLKNYQYEGHFGHLYELYEKNELTSAINRVVEDMNHRFTLEVLTRDFESHDLGVSASNLANDREHPTDVLHRINTAEVTKQLRGLLEIRNLDEQTVKITDAHRREIEEYLRLLDLTEYLDVVNIADPGNPIRRVAFTQSGLRYAQVKALIEALLRDKIFFGLSMEERTCVTERILTEVRGRIMEDIVLLETKMARPACHVFQLQFPVGEFDMVVFDPGEGSCRIYEVKHSAERTAAQYRHLVDPEKCRRAEFYFGPIREKTVIYRGEDAEENGIRYVNVEEYLKELGA